MAIGISDLPSTILVHHHVSRFVHRVLRFFASQTSLVNARGHLRVRLLWNPRGVEPINDRLQHEDSMLDRRAPE